MGTVPLAFEVLKLFLARASAVIENPAMSSEVSFTLSFMFSNRETKT